MQTLAYLSMAVVVVAGHYLGELLRWDQDTTSLATLAVAPVVMLAWEAKLGHLGRARHKRAARPPDLG